MQAQEPGLPKGPHPQLDWGQFRIWQIWDPVPWWILDREKLQEVFVLQLDRKIEEINREVEALHHEVERIQKIRQIVTRK